MARTAETLKGSPQDVGQLADVLKRVGVPLEALDPVVVSRLRLLFDRTATVEDCERAAHLAQLVFERAAQQGSPFSELEQATVRWGSLLSDIGKTGPLRATPRQQLLITEMYSIERVPSGSISVSEFLNAYFPSDAAARRELFESLGLDSNMTMREFWNLHVGWTLELLHDRVSLPESVPAAAAHHLLEHVNPRSLVGEDDRFTLPYGSNTDFDRAEKLVIVLDKYDAARRRGGRDHESALRWLEQLIAKSTRFGADADFATLLQLVDAVIRAGGDRLYAEIEPVTAPAAS